LGERERGPEQKPKTGNIHFCKGGKTVTSQRFKWNRLKEGGKGKIDVASFSLLYTHRGGGSIERYKKKKPEGGEYIQR